MNAVRLIPRTSLGTGQLHWHSARSRNRTIKQANDMASRPGTATCPVCPNSQGSRAILGAPLPSALPATHSF